MGSQGPITSDQRDHDLDGHVSVGETLFNYVRHPHIEARKSAGPVRVGDQHRVNNVVSRFNTALAIRITNVVGTMGCAYAFTALALVSLPAAIKTGDPIIIVAWVAQTFLQLVLLSVVLLGQKLMAQASDKRAEATWHDASATLHEAEQIQQHLATQDAVLASLIDHVKSVTTPVPGGTTP